MTAFFESKIIKLNSNGSNGPTIEFNKKDIKIGSHIRCDFILENSIGFHCAIEADAFGRVTIINHDKQPIIVNGQRIFRRRPLPNNSVIEINGIQLKWAVIQAAAAAQHSQSKTPTKNVIIKQMPRSAPSKMENRSIMKKFKKLRKNRFTMYKLEGGISKKTSSAERIPEERAAEIERSDDESDDDDEEIKMNNTVNVVQNKVIDNLNTNNDTKENQSMMIDLSTPPINKLNSILGDTENRKKNILKSLNMSGPLIVTCTPQSRINSFHSKHKFNDSTNQSENQLTPAIACKSMYLIDLTTPTLNKSLTPQKSAGQQQQSPRSLSTVKKSNTTLLKSALKNSTTKILSKSNIKSKINQSQKSSPIIKRLSISNSCNFNITSLAKKKLNTSDSINKKTPIKGIERIVSVAPINKLNLIKVSADEQQQEITPKSLENSDINDFQTCRKFDLTPLNGSSHLNQTIIIDDDESVINVFDDDDDQNDQNIVKFKNDPLKKQQLLNVSGISILNKTYEISDDEEDYADDEINKKDNMIEDDDDDADEDTLTLLLNKSDVLSADNPVPDDSSLTYLTSNEETVDHDHGASMNDKNEKENNKALNKTLIIASTSTATSLAIKQMPDDKKQSSTTGSIIEFINDTPSAKSHKKHSFDFVKEFENLQNESGQELQQQQPQQKIPIPTPRKLETPKPMARLPFNISLNTSTPKMLMHAIETTTSQNHDSDNKSFNLSENLFGKIFETPKKRSSSSTINFNNDEDTDKINANVLVHNEKRLSQVNDVDDDNEEDIESPAPSPSLETSSSSPTKNTSLTSMSGHCGRPSNEPMSPSSSSAIPPAGNVIEDNSMIIFETQQNVDHDINDDDQSPMFSPIKVSDKTIKTYDILSTIFTNRIGSLNESLSKETDNNESLNENQSMKFIQEIGNDNVSSSANMANTNDESFECEQTSTINLQLSVSSTAPSSPSSPSSTLPPEAQQQQQQPPIQNDALENIHKRFSSIKARKPIHDPLSNGNQSELNSAISNVNLQQQSNEWISNVINETNENPIYINLKTQPKSVSAAVLNSNQREGSVQKESQTNVLGSTTKFNDHDVEKSINANSSDKTRDSMIAKTIEQDNETIDSEVSLEFIKNNDSLKIPPKSVLDSNQKKRSVQKQSQTNILRSTTKFNDHDLEKSFNSNSPDKAKDSIIAKKIEQISDDETMDSEISLEFNENIDSLKTPQKSVLDSNQKTSVQMESQRKSLRSTTKSKYHDVEKSINVNVSDKTRDAIDKKIEQVGNDETIDSEISLEFIENNDSLKTPLKSELGLNQTEGSVQKQSQTNILRSTTKFNDHDLEKSFNSNSPDKAFAFDSIIAKKIKQISDDETMDSEISLEFNENIDSLKAPQKSVLDSNQKTSVQMESQRKVLRSTTKSKDHDVEKSINVNVSDKTRDSIDKKIEQVGNDETIDSEISLEFIENNDSLKTPLKSELGSNQTEGSVQKQAQRKSLRTTTAKFNDDELEKSINPKASDKTRDSSIGKKIEQHNETIDSEISLEFNDRNESLKTPPKCVLDSNQKNVSVQRQSETNILRSTTKFNDHDLEKSFNSNSPDKAKDSIIAKKIEQISDDETMDSEISLEFNENIDSLKTPQKSELGSNQTEGSVQKQVQRKSLRTTTTKFNDDKLEKSINPKASDKTRDSSIGKKIEQYNETIDSEISLEFNERNESLKTPPKSVLDSNQKRSVQRESQTKTLRSTTKFNDHDLEKSINANASDKTTDSMIAKTIEQDNETINSEVSLEFIKNNDNLKTHSIQKMGSIQRQSLIVTPSGNNLIKKNLIKATPDNKNISTNSIMSSSESTESSGDSFAIDKDMERMPDEMSSSLSASLSASSSTSVGQQESSAGLITKRRSSLRLSQSGKELPFKDCRTCDDYNKNYPTTSRTLKRSCSLTTPRINSPMVKSLNLSLRRNSRKNDNNIIQELDELTTADMNNSLYNKTIRKIDFTILEDINENVEENIKKGDDDVDDNAVPSSKRTAANDIKKQFSPKNELSKFVGVKELMKTPYNKNDLSDVKGVKQLYSQRNHHDELQDLRGVKELLNTPHRNELQDLRGVKELLNTPYRNDLDDLCGVKELLNTPHRNELQDLRGVKELLNTPYRNDLDDLCGVKELLNTPHRNDLEDLRGIRQIMKTPKVINKTNNNITMSHSGLDTIFNDDESTDPAMNPQQTPDKNKTSDELFDEFIGKSTLKTYSRKCQPSPIKILKIMEFSSPKETEKIISSTTNTIMEPIKKSSSPNNKQSPRECPNDVYLNEDIHFESPSNKQITKSNVSTTPFKPKKTVLSSKQTDLQKSNIQLSYQLLKEDAEMKSNTESEVKTESSNSEEISSAKDQTLRRWGENEIMTEDKENSEINQSLSETEQFQQNIKMSSPEVNLTSRKAIANSENKDTADESKNLSKANEIVAEVKDDSEINESLSETEQLQQNIKMSSPKSSLTSRKEIADLETEQSKIDYVAESKPILQLKRKRNARTMKEENFDESKDSSSSISKVKQSSTKRNVKPSKKQNKLQENETTDENIEKELTSLNQLQSLNEIMIPMEEKGKETNLRLVVNKLKNENKEDSIKESKINEQKTLSLKTTATKMKTNIIEELKDSQETESNQESLPHKRKNKLTKRNRTKLNSPESSSTPNEENQQISSKLNLISAKSSDDAIDGAKNIETPYDSTSSIQGSNNKVAASRKLRRLYSIDYHNNVSDVSNSYQSPSTTGENATNHPALSLEVNHIIPSNDSEANRIHEENFDISTPRTLTKNINKSLRNRNQPLMFVEDEADSENNKLNATDNGKNTENPGKPKRGRQPKRKQLASIIDDVDDNDQDKNEKNQSPKINVNEMPPSRQSKRIRALKENIDNSREIESQSKVNRIESEVIKNVDQFEDSNANPNAEQSLKNKTPKTPVTRKRGGKTKPLSDEATIEETQIKKVRSNKESSIEAEISQTSSLSQTPQLKKTTRGRPPNRAIVVAVAAAPPPETILNIETPCDDDDDKPDDTTNNTIKLKKPILRRRSKSLSDLMLNITNEKNVSKSKKLNVITEENSLDSIETTKKQTKKKIPTKKNNILIDPGYEEPNNKGEKSKPSTTTSLKRTLRGRAQSTASIAAAAAAASSIISVDVEPDDEIIASVEQSKPPTTSLKRTLRGRAQSTASIAAAATASSPSIISVDVEPLDEIIASKKPRTRKGAKQQTSIAEPPSLDEEMNISKPESEENHFVDKKLIKNKKQTNRKQAEKRPPSSPLLIENENDVNEPNAPTRRTRPKKQPNIKETPSESQQSNEIVEAAATAVEPATVEKILSPPTTRSTRSRKLKK